MSSIPRRVTAELLSATPNFARRPEEQGLINAVLSKLSEKERQHDRETPLDLHQPLRWLATYYSLTSNDELKKK
jgi:hypothetical protein